MNKSRIIFAGIVLALVGLAIIGASYIGIVETLWAWIISGILFVAWIMFVIEIEPRCGCGTCPPNKTCMPGPK